jgi:HNH endonuclease
MLATCGIISAKRVGRRAPHAPNHTYDYWGVARMSTTSVPRFHICPFCHQSFRPRARTSKYCSRVCAMKARALPREVRFWRHVEKTETCWFWTSSLNPGGYGVLKNPVGSTSRYCFAHRLSYEMHHGPIPAGLTIDHLCRVRHCVRPDHLEVVSRGENVLRGESLPAQNRRKQCCINGHAFTPVNTYIRPDGDRGCRTCGAITARRIHARKRQQR